MGSTVKRLFEKLKQETQVDTYIGQVVRGANHKEDSDPVVLYKGVSFVIDTDTCQIDEPEVGMEVTFRVVDFGGPMMVACEVTLYKPLARTRKS